MDDSFEGNTLEREQIVEDKTLGTLQQSEKEEKLVKKKIVKKHLEDKIRFKWYNSSWVSKNFRLTKPIKI